MIKIKQIGKLKGEEDYILWKDKLENFFKANGNKDALTEKPADDAEKALAWTEAQEKYVAQVMHSIEDTILHRVPEDKQQSVNDVLKFLDAEFNSKGEAAFLATYVKLINLKQKDCQNLQDYLNKMLKLFEKCALFDKPVDEASKVAFLMGGLGKEFDPIVQVLKVCAISLDKPTTVEILKQALLSSKIKQVEREKSTALNAKRGFGNFRGRGKGRSGRSGDNMSFTPKKEDDEEKRGKCWNCGKPGHLKKDCWSPRKSSEASASTTVETFASEAQITDEEKCFKAIPHEDRVSNGDEWMLLCHPQTKKK